MHQCSGANQQVYNTHCQTLSTQAGRQKSGLMGNGFIHAKKGDLSHHCSKSLEVPGWCPPPQEPDFQTHNRDR
jgi:hypothetical protein